MKGQITIDFEYDGKLSAEAMVEKITDALIDSDWVEATGKELSKVSQFVHGFKFGVTQVVAQHRD